MKKELFFRSVAGFPIGIAICYIITIGISAALGNGTYYACDPDLISAFGSELNAVIVQTILSGFLGAGFACASLIWKLESWSLAKQTAMYFLVISLIMMPVAWILHWMDHTLVGVLGYFCIFALIFLVIWIIQYSFMRRNIREMNLRLQNLSNTKE